MSNTHDERTDDSRPGSRPESIRDEGPGRTLPTTDDRIPGDRAPSAAESDFMSFALFGFLIIFGIGCFILF